MTGAQPEFRQYLSFVKILISCLFAFQEVAEKKVKVWLDCFGVEASPCAEKQWEAEAVERHAFLGAGVLGHAHSILFSPLDEPGKLGL